MAGRNVDTATLVRGRTYTYRSVKYEYRIPVVVTDKSLLAELEDLYDEVTDSDGEVYEKPRFHIQRNVPHPEGRDRPKKPTRLRSDRTPKVRRIRRR